MKITHISLLIALIFNFPSWANDDDYVLLEEIIGQLSADNEADEIHHCRITVNDLLTAGYDINQLNNSIIAAHNSGFEDVYHIMAITPSIELYGYPIKNKLTDEGEVSGKVLLYSSYELTKVREGDPAAHLIEIISDFCP